MSNQVSQERIATALERIADVLEGKKRSVREPGPNVTEEAVKRIRAVREQIGLINTDTDRPSAQLDGPDLQWACRELVAVEAALEGER